MRRRRGYQLHVGTASILLVFLTLCLASFSALTLVNANADKRLSDKLAARTLAYYEAVAEAEEWIAANAGGDAVKARALPAVTASPKTFSSTKTSICV
ncbi:MAG: hypothetical protein IJP92_04295 [Lachnospiraceae bacterium]|nr:hypothetical protein [Lachnospiraceae bacterium]